MVAVKSRPVLRPQLSTPVCFGIMKCNSVYSKNLIPPKPVLGGFDRVAFLLLSMDSLNQTQTAFFTLVSPFLLPRDHNTRIYS